ncbi:DUF2851 family protein [Aquimarina agarilytica]|uniref:DUF2851 family protein n=1 Tax=Aquimarina agarilytica TaxID=1087449 RepID=UPI000289380F|nr:DUF2851 family protein [Aquimarina agarilytica]
MKEDFLYYLWKFQKIDVSQLYTTQGEQVEIISLGTHNTQSPGPDFFNAQLIIGGQKWAGNIEMHVKSSDWFVHKHQHDTNYNTVILHIVWEHDIDVFRSNNTAIPTLQLKDYVSEVALNSYQKLYENASEKWINCEKQIARIPLFTMNNWLERVYFERLEAKSLPILQLLKAQRNDWEAACFAMLAKAYGGNTNGAVFFKIAQSIPFTIIQKTNTIFQLEALLFGQANLLQEHLEDPYYQSLQKEYNYLKHKYKLGELIGLQVQFFKLRPSNFPSLRLSQLAAFYVSNKNVFTLLMSLNKLHDIEKILQVKSSEYWETHYTFGKTSKKSIKKVSKAFVELLLINAILPLRFVYENSRQKFDSENLLNLLKLLKFEKNTISNRYRDLGVPMENALHSQASLTLKKEYCDQHKCLDCAVGYQLLTQVMQ